MLGLTRENLRHLRAMILQGRRPVPAVYESIGADFFLAVAPGWLNLGWWEGEGTEAEAPRAPVRLVEKLAERLPPGGATLDVANGLGAQDPVIARVVRPRLLAAVNVTELQLRAGRERLEEARARPVLADAVRLPFGEDTFDGLISVEAAFHFPSRAAFFREAVRVLRPGGVLSMSDVTAERWPRGVRDAAAGLAQLRLWGLRVRQLATGGRVAALAEEAGLEDVRVELCASRTIDPALRLMRGRLAEPRGASGAQVWASGVALRQIERLRAGGYVQYALLTARAPDRAKEGGPTLAPK